MMAKYDQLNPPALKRLLAGGTKLHVFSQPIMEASYKAAMELHGEISKENASFKKVNDSLMDWTKNGYQWFQVAELSYDSFMVRHSR
jgi:TRAP-type mannitol/chloroaromatic compound transport system substrate-binding protein